MSSGKAYVVSFIGRGEWRQGREKERERMKERERDLPPQRKGRKRAGVGTAYLLKGLFTTVQSQDTACHV